MKAIDSAAHLALAISLVAMLAACSTTYGKMGFDGGVAAAPVTSDTFRISARGNGFTDATTVQDYVLLKAAETAIGAGQTHFTIVNNRDATSTSYGQTSGSFSNWGGGFVTYNPGMTYDIVKPGEDLMVRVWTPKKGEVLPPNTFNAQEVYANINPRVKRSKE